MVDRICTQTLRTATSAVMVVDPRGGMQVLVRKTTRPGRNCRPGARSLSARRGRARLVP
jgi:hypothetical protein